MSKKYTLTALLAATMMMNAAVTHAEDDNSALESYNRAMFSFNTGVDDYVLKPVAKGYRAVTTEFIRERVRNFFENLKEPASMINHTLQGNLKDTGVSTGRFLINSTLGLLGTFDVASGWGLNKNKTGLDKTLAAWCVPDGPFFVLPIFGPSTPRAAVGLAGDNAADPLYWANYYASFGKDWERYSFYYGLSALGFVSLREKNLELLDNLTANSVDAYTTIKSAYMQNRLKLNVCADKNAENTPASYDFDFDEEEFDD